MARSRAMKPSPEPSAEPAFLLSQVGAHASAKFAERLEQLGLKPPHAGILRVVEQADGKRNGCKSRSRRRPHPADRASSDQDAP